MILGAATAVAAVSLSHAGRSLAEQVDPGPEQPALAPFDDLMSEFVKANDVPGAALAVSKDRRLVYARGFGKLSPGNATAVEPDTRFRIASISKPVTAVGVLKLVEKRQVDLDRPVLEYLTPETLLKGQVVTASDARWRRVTVRHCLQHTSGMDRGKSGDPIVMFDRVRERFKLEYPIPPEAVVAFTLERPLDTDPGERYAYSNVGYLILGRIIEKVCGTTYPAFVENEVLKPLGIRRMELARALPKDRPSDEAGYLDRKARTSPCIYPPHVGQPVPLLDGGFNLEAYEAHGGWIASPVDLVRFAAAFDDRRKCPLLSPGSVELMFQRPSMKGGVNAAKAPVYYGCGWNVRVVGPGKVNTWHSGLLKPGTSTLLVRRWDGLNWAVLFNVDCNPQGVDLAGLIDPLIHRAADAVRTWPANDLFPQHGV